MRFYVRPDSIFPDKNLIEIRDKAEIHHIRDVMRIQEGLEVTVFDGQGKEFSGCIKKIGRSAVVIEIKNTAYVNIDRDFKITLYQAIPKRAKMDFIIEKAVELGVDAIVPIATKRTVFSVKDVNANKKDRWSRIAKAASKQCGRVRLPEISDVMDFDSAIIGSKKSDLVLFAALDKNAESLRSVLKDKKPDNISVFIGPEGDFDKEEVEAAKRHGFNICSLGALVLRVETAALYILSCLNYEYAR